MLPVHLPLDGCKILSLVIFPLYLISGGSSCSTLLSSTLRHRSSAASIQEASDALESVGCEVPPLSWHSRSHSWDFRVDLRQQREKKNEYRPELREWTSFKREENQRRRVEERRREEEAIKHFRPLSCLVIRRLRDFYLGRQNCAGNFTCSSTGLMHICQTS